MDKLTGASPSVLGPKIIQLNLGAYPRTVCGGEPGQETGSCLVKVRGP